MPSKVRRFKQRGGAASDCPPGVFCLSSGVMLALLGIAVLLAGVFVWLGLRAQNSTTNPVNIRLEMPASAGGGGTSRSTGGRNIPPAPERTYGTGPDYDSAGSVYNQPIFNVPTQGYAENYQQVGLLVAPGGSKLTGTGERTLVPLYGRRIAARKDKWNYYMRTDGLNPVEVPVRFKNRDCDDDIGCDEVYNGDDVSVPAEGTTYKVQVYKQKGPVYNPFA